MLRGLHSITLLIDEDFQNQPERIGEEVNSPSDRFQHEIVSEGQHRVNETSARAEREEKRSKTKNVLKMTSMSRRLSDWLLVLYLVVRSSVRFVCLFLRLQLRLFSVVVVAAGQSFDRI